MLYLLWAILNIALVLGFLFICIKSVRPIKEKMGVTAALVFIVGLLCLINNSTNYFDVETKTFVFAPIHAFDNKPGNNKFSATIDNSLVFKISLSVLYNVHDDTVINRIAANSGMDGLAGPHTWIPRDIKAETAGNKIKYNVYGNIEWRLLGIKVYTEPKKYSGFIATEQVGNKR